MCVFVVPGKKSTENSDYLFPLYWTSRNSIFLPRDEKPLIEDYTSWPFDTDKCLARRENKTPWIVNRRTSIILNRAAVWNIMIGKANERHTIYKYIELKRGEYCRRHDDPSADYLTDAKKKKMNNLRLLL